MTFAFLVSHPIQYQAPLFRELAKRVGSDFRVLFCSKHGAEPTFDKQFGKVIQFDVPLLDGYDHEFLPNVSPRPSLSPLGLINPGVLASLKDGRFSALIFHGYSHATNVLGLLGPRRRTKVLLRGESNLRAPRTVAKRAGKQALLRGIFSRVDHFLSIGTLNTEYYRHYGVPRDRITLAPYAVDNDFFAERSRGARESASKHRAGWGLPVDGPLFMFSAKLIPKKRPLDVVRAFARTVDAGPAAFIIVGDGELRPQVEAEIAALGIGQRVRLLGFVNQSQLPVLYGTADVLVLPSDLETWGVVVNEALACGATALVSDQVGAGVDLVDPSSIFPVGDIDALSEAMRSLITSPERLRVLKEKGRQRIQSWGISQAADGFLRGVERALG